MQSALKGLGQISSNKYDVDSPVKSPTKSPRQRVNNTAIKAPISTPVKMSKRSQLNKKVSFRKGRDLDDASMCSATEVSMSSASLASLGRLSPQKQKSLRNLALNILSMEPVSPIKPVSPVLRAMSSSSPPLISPLKDKCPVRRTHSAQPDLSTLLEQLATAFEVEEVSSSSKHSNSLRSSLAEVVDESLTEDYRVEMESTFFCYASSMVNADDTSTMWVHAPNSARPHLELNVSREALPKETPEVPKTDDAEEVETPSKESLVKSLFNSRRRRRRRSMV